MRTGVDCGYGDPISCIADTAVHDVEEFQSWTRSCIHRSCASSQIATVEFEHTRRGNTQKGMDSCYGDHIDLVAASVTFIYTFHTFSPIRRGSHIQMSDYNPLTTTTGNSEHTVDYCYGDHMVHFTTPVTSPPSAFSFPSLPPPPSSHRVTPAVVCFLNG